MKILAQVSELGTYCWQLSKVYRIQGLMIIIIAPVFTRKRVDFYFQVKFLTKLVFAG